MCSEFAVASIKDDLATLQQIWRKLTHSEHIAGPDGRQHAEAGDLQFCGAGGANHFGYQIATCRMKVRFPNHGRPA
jgi:hypothetical protein